MDTAAPVESKFKIKKFNAVALWSWNIEVETCAICRNNLMDPCIECQSNAVQDADCQVAWGNCNHAFHYHCISRWLQSRQVCPLDNQQWAFQKYGR